MRPSPSILKCTERLTLFAHWPGLVTILLAIILGILGVCLVSDSYAVPATTWMNIYAPEDFHTLADWAVYVRDLRVPIPPILSTLEIWSYLAAGSTAIVTTHLYRMSIVGSYLLALVLCYPSRPKAVVAFLVALPSMWGTVVVHRGNPQVYDVVYPFLILGFVGLLTILKHRGWLQPRFVILLSCLAGVILASAELTRPFVLYLMPLLLVGGILVIRPLGRPSYVAFVLPLVLISGLWHLHQAAAHGQLLWTNHSGFNLVRAWSDTPTPVLVPEPGAVPIAPGRWENLNTAEHLTNSRILQAAVLGQVARHPWQAATQALQKLFYFASAPTEIYTHTPDQPALVVYRSASLLLFLLLFANALLLFLLFLEAPKRALTLLAEPQNLLICVAICSLVFLALGEAEEEARLVLSILPMVAGLPMAGRPSTEERPQRRLSVVGMLLCGGALVAASPAIDLWRARPIDFGTRQWALVFGGLMCIFLAGRTMRHRTSKE